MKISKQVMGYADTNTYYLEKNGQVVVIDPCLDPQNDASRLLKPLEGKTVIGILITHGHFDHISGIDALTREYDCPVYMYHEELHYLKNPAKNLSNQTGELVVIQTPVEAIDLEPLDVGEFEFDVIKTPGHTSGSISYIIDNHIFDGDFIFNMSVGRTDLPTGSDAVLRKAMKDFAQTFAKQDMLLYPGHGDITTVDFEIKHNPFF